MLLLHTCGCASPIQSGPPPSFSRATLAPSASARTEARSHRGCLHIFREQSEVPLDLIRYFPFNGLRRPPRATSLPIVALHAVQLLLRVLLPNPCSLGLAASLPRSHTRVRAIWAYSCPDRTIRARANRASSALRARSAQHLHTPPASAALPRACSRHPLGVAHICSCTASRAAHEFASHPHAASVHSPARTRSLLCTSTLLLPCTPEPHHLLPLALRTSATPEPSSLRSLLCASSRATAPRLPPRAAGLPPARSTRAAPPPGPCCSASACVPCSCACSRITPAPCVCAHAAAVSLRLWLLAPTRRSHAACAKPSRSLDSCAPPASWAQCTSCALASAPRFFLPPVARAWPSHRQSPACPRLTHHAPAASGPAACRSCFGPLSLASARRTSAAAARLSRRPRARPGRQLVPRRPANSRSAAPPGPASRAPWLPEPAPHAARPSQRRREPPGCLALPSYFRSPRCPRLLPRPAARAAQRPAWGRRGCARLVGEEEEREGKGEMSLSVNGREDQIEEEQREKKKD
jgi:hypothetical protein